MSWRACPDVWFLVANDSTPERGRGNIAVPVKPQIVLPTLPSLPAIDGSENDRLALLAGLTFVEGATSGWGARDLTEWFTMYGAVMGKKGTPPAVTDAVVGTISLVPGARVAGDKVARLEELPKLLAMSRWRVVVTLRGLISQPCDDRFLQAAIFAERVRRNSSRWVAQPRDNDLLSDIVLSLFAVDILTQRSFYEQNMCVCDVCGRISFNPGSTSRSGCSDHPPRSESASGFQTKDPRVPSPPPSRRGHESADGPVSGPVSGRKPRG